MKVYSWATSFSGLSDESGKVGGGGLCDPLEMTVREKGGCSGGLQLSGVKLAH